MIRVERSSVLLPTNNFEHQDSEAIDIRLGRDHAFQCILWRHVSTVKTNTHFRVIFWSHEYSNRINIDKRRAVRIPDDQYTAYGVELDEKSDIKIEKLEKLQEVTSKNFFKVRYGDIDSNMHVNNVRYVEWAVESLPLEIVLNYELKDLSVVFEKECKYGAEIIASYELREDNDELIVLHKIENDEGTELSILKSRWIKLKN